jgi:hypothetical protein
MFLPAKVELNEDGRRLKWEGVISVEAAQIAVSSLVMVKRETIDDNDEVEWLDENGKSVVIKKENEMMDVDMPLDVQPVVVFNSEDVGAVIIHKSEPLDLDCDVNLDNMENNNGDENVPDTNSTETTETSVPLIVKVESMAGQIKKETMEEVENNGNVRKMHILIFQKKIQVKILIFVLCPRYKTINHPAIMLLLTMIVICSIIILSR